MMHIQCASCKQSVEIEDFLTAAKQPCPHCGRFIIGGGDPQTPPSDRPAWEPPPARGPFMRLLNFVCGNNPLGLRTALFGQRVVLDRREVSHLPAVCMKCGAPTDRVVPKSFVDQRASGWSQLTNTPDTLTAEAMARTPGNQPLGPWVTIDVPLCSTHARQFVWQNLWIYLGIVGIVAAIGWTAIAPAADRVFVMLPVTIMVVLIAIGCRGIRAGRFFDVYVEIWGVSPRFIHALAEHRTARLNKDAF
jgi:hypothetical protein